MSNIKHAINAEKAKGVTIRFEIRKEKADKEGRAPIRLIFQIKGQRKYFNVGQNILPQCWDVKRQEAIYIDKKTARKISPDVDYNLFLTETEAKEFNDGIGNVIKSTKEITDRFILDKIPFSAEMVIDKLKQTYSKFTKRTEETNYLFDFIDKYIEDNKNTREPGSLIVYKSMKAHLKAFQQETSTKVTFDKINYSFFQSFQNFLIGRTKVVAGDTVPMLNNTTISKQLSTIKTFLNYAKIQGINVPDGYKNFKITKEKLEVIALTDNEFERIYNLDLSNNKRLAQVRDIFCFSCCTGFRYSDLHQLKREHIKEDVINLRVIKTGEILNVPLTPYSKAILSKYKKTLRPLPMISNQRLNDYIKELCKLAGINELIEIVRFRGVKREAVTYPKYELLSIHSGRKTFASLSLEKGMSTQQVMAIGGWKDYKSFERYVSVTEKLKIVSMNKAWGDNTKKLKAV